MLELGLVVNEEDLVLREDGERRRPPEDLHGRCAFWLGIAQGFFPWVIKNSSGNHTDLVMRYFDASFGGIKWMVERKLQVWKVDELTPEVVLDLIQQQWGFFGQISSFVALRSVFFKKFFDVVIPPADEKREFSETLTCLHTSMQALRISALVHRATMANTLNTWRVWSFNYRWEDVSGSFVPVATSGYSPVEEIPVQKPVGGTGMLTIHEFLMTKRFNQDSPYYHWAHAESPNLDACLAFAHKYEFSAQMTNILAGLSNARCEISSSGNGWFFIVFPSISISKDSRKSLKQGRNTKSMRELRRLLTEGKSSEGNIDVSNVVEVCVIEQKMLLAISVEQKTALTFGSGAQYAAAWKTPADNRRSAGFKWHLICCCGRATDGDSGATGIQETLHKKIKSTGFATHDCPFELMFGQTLLDLSKPYGPLRKSGPSELAYSMLLDQTQIYLDALGVYQVAITKLEALIKSPTFREKRLAVTRISNALIELQILASDIEAFNKVLDKLPQMTFVNSGGSVPEMRDNVESFLEGCMSEIGRCQSIAADFDARARGKASQIINVLTVVMFSVLPVQLMTAWYGMNWPDMPELFKHNAYWIFIAIIVLVELVQFSLAFFMYRQS